MLNPPVSKAHPKDHSLCGIDYRPYHLVPINATSQSSEATSHCFSAPPPPVNPPKPSAIPPPLPPSLPPSPPLPSPTSSYPTLIRRGHRHQGVMQGTGTGKRRSYSTHSTCKSADRNLLLPTLDLAIGKQIPCFQPSFAHNIQLQHAHVSRREEREGNY